MAEKVLQSVIISSGKPRGGGDMGDIRNPGYLLYGKRMDALKKHGFRKVVTEVQKDTEIQDFCDKL